MKIAVATEPELALSCEMHGLEIWHEKSQKQNFQLYSMLRDNLTVHQKKEY